VPSPPPTTQIAVANRTPSASAVPGPLESTPRLELPNGPCGRGEIGRPAERVIRAGARVSPLIRPALRSRLPCRVCGSVEAARQPTWTPGRRGGAPLDQCPYIVDEAGTVGPEVVGNKVARNIRLTQRCRVRPSGEAKSKALYGRRRRPGLPTGPAPTRRFTGITARRRGENDLGAEQLKGPPPNVARLFSRLSGQVQSRGVASRVLSRRGTEGGRSTCTR